MSAAWSLYIDTTENWAYQNNVFTKEECQTIIKIGNEKLGRATVIGNDQSVRDSQVAWLSPTGETEFAFQRLTESIININEKYFKFDLSGFNEGFQFTRYDAPSGYYGRHIDKIYNGAIRKLSVTIQLSEPSEYEGGELCLHYADKPEVIPKEQAKLIAFPSYALHEVTPVTKGTRYSLVAWITGKPFK